MQWHIAFVEVQADVMADKPRAVLNISLTSLTCVPLYFNGSDQEEIYWIILILCYFRFFKKSVRALFQFLALNFLATFLRCTLSDEPHNADAKSSKLCEYHYIVMYICLCCLCRCVGVLFLFFFWTRKNQNKLTKPTAIHYITVCL